MIASHGQIRVTGLLLLLLSSLLASCLRPRYSKPIGNNSRSCCGRTIDVSPPWAFQKKSPSLLSTLGLDFAPRFNMNRIMSKLQGFTSLYKSLVSWYCVDVACQYSECPLTELQPGPASIWSGLAISKFANPSPRVKDKMQVEVSPRVGARN